MKLSVAILISGSGSNMVHLVTAELDGGPVLAQTKVLIEKNETVDSLKAKVLIQEHVLYPKVLLNFSNHLRKSLEAENCK